MRDITAISDMFDAIDVDGSGEVDAREFISSESWKEMTHITEDELDELFESIDADGDGTVSLSEMFKVAFPMASKAQRHQMLNFCRERREVAAERAHAKRVRGVT